MARLDGSYIPAGTSSYYDDIIGISRCRESSARSTERESTAAVRKLQQAILPEVRACRRPTKKGCGRARLPGRQTQTITCLRVCVTTFIYENIMQGSAACYSRESTINPSPSVAQQGRGSHSTHKLASCAEVHTYLGHSPPLSLFSRSR